MKTGSLKLDIGTILDGRYEILSYLGQGGMGTVYKAYDRRLENFVAIKIINLDSPEDHRHVLRFKREVEATSRLDHPSITKVLDFSPIDSVQPYLVMEFVEGRTLASMIAEQGQLPLAETLSIFIAVCDGLTHAHENNVLHRDLKPSNIMISRDSGTTSVKILDFGIAKILESTSVPSLHITRTGELLGSPFYMSPEQARSGQIDHRSDLYSLGCTMYEALTGGPPHMGESPISTLLKRESDAPVRMAEASLGRKFPEKLEIIVAKLLKHDPNERYQSANDLKRELLRISEEPATATAEAIISQRKSGSHSGPRTRRSPRLVLVWAAFASLAVLCSALYVVLSWHEWQPNVQKPPETRAAPPQETQEPGEDVFNASTAKAEAARLRSVHKYDLAEQNYLQALKDFSSAPGNHLDEIAKVRKELAWNYMLKKQQDKASKQYEQALAYYENSLNPEDPRIAEVSHSLAGSYREAGDRASLNKAIPFFEKATNYYRNHLPQTYTELVECLVEEAETFEVLSNFVAEKRVLLELLKLKTSKFGDRHLETLSMLERLGAACRKQNKYDEAMGYDKKWLAAYNDSPDDPQPDRLKAVLTLGSDYYCGSNWTNMSMLRSGLKLLERGLKICRRDPAHFEGQTGQTLERLGVLYQNLWRDDPTYMARAERCGLEAASIYKRIPNFDKGAIANVLKRTAEVQITENHPEDSLRTALEALKLRTKISGANSKEVMDIYWDLGEIYRRKGKLSEANAYYARVLPLSRRYQGADSIKTSGVLAAWAENARIQGDFPTARKLLVECLSIRRRTLGPKHPDIVWAESTLKNVNDCLKNPANTKPSPPKSSDH